ncbi:hypothetical protein [Sphingomonas sp. PvP018]|uniref:hypothetical protein n=1 Tax=Sphingomonas sp. PvP018 TaxID=2817852 RepID=UPI001AE7D258|nr:hypothetical protein [Sphingomonas sp. PvP018]MBP2513811.1 DNA-binding transcriptional MocR family regulator [Sphingomonas sp. PvP018]
MRCGHTAARPDWIEALADLRLATSMFGNPLSAALLHGVLTDGSYGRHMERYMRFDVSMCDAESLFAFLERVRRWTG